MNYYTQYDVQVLTSILLTLVYVVLASWFLASLYNFFFFRNKYGEKGWKGFIPVYNSYIYFEKTFGKGKGWLAFAYIGISFIPFINILLLPYTVYYFYNFLKSFGKNENIAFTLFFSFIPVINIIYVLVLIGYYIYLLVDKNTVYVGSQKHFGLKDNEVKEGE